MNIDVLYIDDDLDPFLARYLKEEFDEEIFENGRLNPPQKALIHYREYEYNPEDNYQALFQSEIVKSAKVILADHRLYTNNQENSYKFSGSQFLLLAKLRLPQAEVLVITQEENRTGELILHKYESEGDSYDHAKKYYDENIKCAIESAIRRVMEEQIIGDEVENNKEIDAILKTRVDQMLSGTVEYSELSSADVNSLVQAFKDIKEIIK